MSLTPEQIAVLLRPIRPNRVAKRDGQSNVEAYEIRAHLTRIFGFGNWDEIAVSSRLLYEEPITLKNGKDGWKVAYSADRCIRIRDHDGIEVCEHHGSAVGEAQMPNFKRGDCHDFALKKAQSQALKRAAINLGDQYGLSLYRGGSTDALVGKVVGVTEQGHDVEMHEPDVVEGYDPDATPDAESPEPETPVSPSTEPDIAPETDEQLPLGGESDEFLATDKQIRKVVILFGEMGIKDRTDRIDYINAVLGTNVKSSKEMTMTQAGQLIEHMEAEPA